MGEKINYLYYMRLFNRQKRWLSILVGTTALLCLAAGLASPRTYSSTTTILIPGSVSSSLSTLGGVLGAPGMFAGARLQDALVTIIKSRRMGEDIAADFQLDKRYGISKQDAVNRAKKMLYVYMIESGLAIEATTEDPQLSADIVNFCTLDLDNINQQLGLSTEKPFVKVLDRGLPPEYPSSRNIVKNTAVGIMVSAVIGIIIVLLIDFIGRLKKEPTIGG